MKTLAALVLTAGLLVPLTAHSQAVVPGTTEYLADALATTSLRNAFDKALEDAPDWVATLTRERVEVPGSTIRIRGERLDAFFFCRPHMCGDYNGVAFLTKDGGSAYIVAHGEQEGNLVFGTQAKSDLGKRLLQIAEDMR